MRISTATSSVTLTKLPTMGAVIPKSDQTKEVRPENVYNVARRPGPRPGR